MKTGTVVDHNKNELLGETHPLYNPLVDGFPLTDGIGSIFIIIQSLA